MKRCPICAEMVDDHLSVCPYCGEPLPGATPPKNPQPQQPSQPETPQPRQPAQASPGEVAGEKRFCPVCGEQIGAHLTICPVCFEPTGFDAPSTQAAASPQPTVTEQPAAPLSQPAPEPEPTPEPKATPEPEPAPEPTPAPHPKPAPEPKPEPQRYQETESRRYQETESRRQWQPEPAPSTPTAPPKGANPLKWLLITLCVLLAIGIGLLAYFLLRGDKEEEEPSVEPQEENVVAASNELEGEDLLWNRLDSVEKNIPSEASALNVFADAEHPCLYYILDGQLMAYHADTDKTEKVKIPASGKVLDASTDSEDSDYLLIDLGDNSGNYKSSYRMNNATGSFELINEKEPEATAEQTEKNTPSTTAKKSATRNQRPDEEDYYDYPPPPPPHMDKNGNERPRRVFRSEEERAQDRANRMRREGRRPGDYPPPPPSGNGNGFHLEPANPQQGSSGSGIRLEKVDRIPNQ